MFECNISGTREDDECTCVREGDCYLSDSSCQPSGSFNGPCYVCDTNTDLTAWTQQTSCDDNDDCTINDYCFGAICMGAPLCSTYSCASWLLHTYNKLKRKLQLVTWALVNTT